MTLDPEKLLLYVVSGTWAGWMLSFTIGKWVKSREVSEDLPLYRLGVLERRMDQAGQKISDLADEVQTLPERMRTEFVTRYECKLLEERERGSRG